MRRVHEMEIHPPLPHLTGIGDPDGQGSWSGRVNPTPHPPLERGVVHHWAEIHPDSA